MDYIMDKDRLLYVNEHLGCESYDHARPGSLAETLKTSEGMIYERSSKEPELFFVCQGQVLLSFKEKGQRLMQEGEFALIPSDIHFSMEVFVVGSVFFCKLVQEIKFCDSLRLDSLEKYTRNAREGIRVLSMSPAIRRFLDSFLGCLADQLRCKHYIALKVSELLILLRAYYSKEQVAAFFLPFMEPDYQFRNFIYANALTGKSIAELAKLSHMSVNGFLYRFKRVFGCTPSEYISREKAKNIRYDLLCSNLPIKEISERYGFGAVPTFNDFCKKALGKTPGQIRMGA